MILVSHIIIALAGIVYTSYLLFAPSKAKLYTTYGILIATIGSGTYLVVSTGAPLLHACVVGLFYTAFIALGLARAHRKLAQQIASITKSRR